MKENYKELLLEVICFSSSDIVRASNEEENEGEMAPGDKIFE